MAQDLIRDKWSAQAYNANASFVYSDVYTSPILSMLNPKPGENKKKASVYGSKESWKRW